jgi:hypothetical protein
MWEKVKKLDYEFPDGFDEKARDLISRILVSNRDFAPTVLVHYLRKLLIILAFRF